MFSVVQRGCAFANICKSMHTSFVGKLFDSYNVNLEHYCGKYSGDLRGIGLVQEGADLRSFQT